MPKLRAKNDRSGIADLGAHHSYKAPRIPNPRVSTEDFCADHHRLQVALSHNQVTVRLAGKALVRRQNTENIEKLKAAKANVQVTKEMIFEHITNCGQCSSISV